MQSGAGGTPGGVGQFFIGLAMAVAGGYLLLNQVVVTSGGWSLWGYNAFGLSLLPFIVGIGLVFFNGKSVIGWLLMFAGLVIIFAAILMNMSIYFRATTLFNTLMMLGLLAAGIGMIAASLKTKRVSPS